MNRHAYLDCIDQSGSRAKVDVCPHAPKWLSRSLAVLSVALPLAGLSCTTSPVVRIAEPVGPAPSASSAFDEGRLVVRTPLTRDPGDLYTDEYPGTTPSVRAAYEIFDTNGREIQTVTNYVTGTAPETVSLAHGDYLIRAKGPGNQLVDVPVRIEPGKVTEVFLDGSRRPSDFGPNDQVVRAADGTVVGWRATAIGGGPREK